MESIAFGFSENYSDKDTGWGTYFGPKFYISNGDGTANIYPHISQITPECIAYWEQRVEETYNPILKARYCGLIYEFKEKIDEEKVAFKYVKLYVESLIEIAEKDYQLSQYETFIKLHRALSISCSYNMTDLIEKAKECIIEYEFKTLDIDKIGTWGYSYDYLLHPKNIDVSEQNKQHIIDALESKLAHHSQQHVRTHLGAEAAAKRLANHYWSKGNKNDVKRVLNVVKSTLDNVSPSFSPMQTVNWYERLMKQYKRYGLGNEADAVSLIIRRLGASAVKEFKNIPQEFSIPKDIVERFVGNIIEGNSSDILMRIIVNFIPQKEEQKEILLNTMRNGHFIHMLNTVVFDEKGRVETVIGSLENDLEGNLIKQTSQSLHFYSLLLSLVFDSLIGENKITVNDIISFLKLSPIIEDERYSIIERGIGAYFNCDFITSIHLLVPQVEQAIRNLIEKLGGVVTKPLDKGGYDLRTLNSMLSDGILTRIYSEDMIDYFKILLTDKRVWNIRNKVCHGIMKPELLNRIVAERVIHCLLCISLARA